MMLPATRREFDRLHGEIRELHIQIGQLLGMDTVAALVQIGKDAATLDTTPLRQFDMTGDDLEVYRARLRERGHGMVVDGAGAEAEAMAKWRRQGTGRED